VPTAIITSSQGIEKTDFDLAFTTGNTAKHRFLDFAPAKRIQPRNRQILIAGYFQRLVHSGDSVPTDQSLHH